MASSWIYLNAILFCLGLTLAQSFVLRNYTRKNVATRKLNCVSEEDDSALIRNYNPKINDLNNEENGVTNFEPKKRTREYFAECAIWDSNKCIVKWVKMKEWNVVDSFLEPMGPVYDFRCQDFKEFFFEKLMKDQEYQYVGRVKEAFGNVVFSVRGSRGINIFLCGMKVPGKGPCFWIIIGGGRGKRSEIRSCVDGLPETLESKEGKDCIVVANVAHGVKSVVDAYEWRTFRLGWNSQKKVIEIFNETEIEPFLEGKVTRWYPASHLSIKSELASRIRFHFYEYFLTRRENAVMSTAEFTNDDEKFCADVLVGICPECELKISLTDSKDGEIVTENISGSENPVMTWQSIRINVNLPSELNSGSLKLEIVTVLMKNGTEGYWAMDNFRKCKPVGALRKSSITTQREMRNLATYFWPKIKCQKLFYTGDTVVDSLLNRPYRSVNHIFPTEKTIATVIPLTNSKVRATEKQQKSSEETNVEIYEVNPTKNTISIRLRPATVRQLKDLEFEAYVSINDGTQQLGIRYLNRSEVKDCSLWKDSVCFGNLHFQTINLDTVKTSHYDIKVRAWNKDIEIFAGGGVYPLDLHTEPSSKPTNLELTNQGNGIVTVKWEHPLFPKSKIIRFDISFDRRKTNLTRPPVNETRNLVDFPFDKKKKEYKTELRLLTSTKYRVYVKAINQNISSEPAFEDIWVSSAVNFAIGEKLRVTHNGTLIELEMPEVVNATSRTWIRVSVNGTMTCTQKDSANSSTPAKHNMTEYEWNTALYRVNKNTPRKLEIGLNHDFGVKQCALHPGKTYVIEVRVEDWFTNESKSLTSDPITLPPITHSSTDDANLQDLNLIYLILCPIAAFCLLLLFICYCFKKRRNVRTASKNQLTSACTLRLSTLRSDAKENGMSTSQCEVEPDVVEYSRNSKPVKVEEFEEYVKKALASGVLNSQYEMFPMGLTKPCDYGSLPGNVSKNRYKNLRAYDETRVHLEKIAGDPHSDYINANYIQGHRKEKAYIATQGPLAKTVKDFWRMIWQEEVHVICMLGNVIEGGKKKCEQYWPEVGTKIKYGDILITNTKHSVFADYTFRTLTLRCREETREVAHLHYTGWPDHGVPMYTQSLVSYLKTLQQTPTGNGPVVVHCSAGVGRTGTIILCDICLQQARAEKAIDVLGVISQMRESRAGMVNSAQQYLLAHLTIVESMVPMLTQISCTYALPEEIKQLKKQLSSDMKRLNDIVWQDRALHSLAAQKHQTPQDVTYDEVPDDQDINEMEISSRFDMEDNDINAVCVDGVKMKKQYLASRLPSSSTLTKFWKVIVDRRIELVVILQRPNPKDHTFCDIIPTESIFVPYSGLQVESKTSLIREEYFTVKKLLLTKTPGEESKPQPVTVLTCTGWDYRRKGKPPTPPSLVSLWRASEKISRKESPTLVLCHDGVTACGLYLALSFLLERMAVERECDVISAVRAVRRSKPEFVQSMKQFEYLYDAAMYYIKCFETYSNFS